MQTTEIDYADGISAIDSGYVRPMLDAVHLVVEDGRAAVVDTGCNDSVPRILAALHARNVAPGQVDWVLLLFFASLFIVVRGIEKVGLMDRMINGISLGENAAGLGGIHLISLVLSQVVSNVPFTVVMLPVM